MATAATVTETFASERRIGAARYAVLVLLCLFAFLPGISTLPPTDRDESRFVQSTKQMVETGNYIDIRLQDENRYKKPIGIYWLQSAAVLISGKGAAAPIWVYRLVSVLGATLAVLAAGWLGARMFGASAGTIAGAVLAGILMLGFEARIAKTDATLLATAMFAQAALARLYLGSRDGAAAPISVYRLVSVLGATLAVLAAGWLGARMFGAAAGMVAGAVLAGILMLGFEARIAKTDATLLATAVFAQAALARLYIGRSDVDAPSRAAPWVFWAAQGAALLIKGPVVPLLSALTVAAIAFFDKDRAWLRQLKPLRGALLAILICVPWLALITWKSGAAFWQESVGKDLLGKVGGGQESHGAPPGYYALIFVLFFWPFAVAGIEAGLKALNRLRSDPRLLFCLAWYIPYWIVVEAIPTKLPHYMLPAYPALALLIAWAATDAGATDMPLRRWQVWLKRLTLAGFVVVTVLLAAASVGATPYLMKHFSWWGLAGAILALAAGWLGSGIRPAAAPARRIALATICSAAFFAVLTVFVLPGLTPVWLSPGISAAFEKAKPCPDSRLIATGYAEPSLVFLAGTNTLLVGPKDAAKALAADRCAVAVVDGRNVEAFTGALPGGQAGVEEVATVRGVNYSKGTERLLILFRNKG
jgi:4-amino-4-deoxy-L-arabinose transferase-like glycosyltransferase